LGIDQPTQLEQRLDGEARRGFILVLRTRLFIEHPSRNTASRTVREHDDQFIAIPTTDPTHDLHRLVIQGMMPIADPSDRRIVSSV
jgi:hypothetical protein